jgi:hypothetical protein
MQIFELNPDERLVSLVVVPRTATGRGTEESSQDLDQKFWSPGPIGNDWPEVEVARDRSRYALPPKPVGRQRLSQPKALLGSGDLRHVWGLGGLAITERAHAVLADLISPSVEFLPLTSREGRFYAIKVLRVLEALDLQQSAIDWSPQLARNAGQQRTASRISRYVFREALLTNETIFKVPECSYPRWVFVTQRFVDAVEGAGLEGFDFRLVAPDAEIRQLDQQYFLDQRRRGKHSQPPEKQS